MDGLQPLVLPLVPDSRTVLWVMSSSYVRINRDSSRAIARVITTESAKNKSEKYIAVIVL